jgi:hypothetical protein
MKQSKIVCKKFHKSSTSFYLKASYIEPLYDFLENAAGIGYPKNTMIKMKVC